MLCFAVMTIEKAEIFVIQKHSLKCINFKWSRNIRSYHKIKIAAPAYLCKMSAVSPGCRCTF